VFGAQAVNDPKPASRKFLTIALAIFLAAILAVIVVAAVQYWGDKRHPDGVPERGGQ
jgi:hypothetical protein